MVKRLNKLCLIALALLFQEANTIETPYKIGIHTIKDTKEYQNTWPVLKPLIDLFTDKNIKAVVLMLEVDYGHFGYANAFGIAKSIQFLKKKYNKPVIAYGENWLAKSSYVIATSADIIMASPICILGHIGYYENFLDVSKKNKKNGYEINPIHVGKYKFLGRDFLPITKSDLKLLQARFDTSFDEIVKHIIALRPQLNEHKNKWINGDLFLPSIGIRTAFIDKIGDKIDLMHLAAELVYNKKLTVEEACKLGLDPILNEPIKIDNLCKIKLNDNKKVKIAICNIIDALDWQDSNYYLALFTELMVDPEISGVIISIDCPGSNSAALMSNLYTQIIKLKKLFKKPVVAYIEKGAGSGGFWISLVADYIIASPLAEIGHIGNTWGRWEHMGADLKEDKTFHTVATNKFINIFNEKTAMTTEQKEMLKKLVTDQYLLFVEQAKEARPLLRNNEHLWKEAQIYVANEALQVGLIDKIGSPTDAIEYINKDCDLENIDFVFRKFNVNKEKH